MDWIESYEISSVDTPDKDELFNALKYSIAPVKVEKYLRSQCMWERFNYMAGTLNKLICDDLMQNGMGVNHENDMRWIYVNRLLRLPISIYDFNAFGEIHGLSEFKEAMELCSSSNYEGVWYIGRCNVCGKKFALEHSAVEEFQKRNAKLPFTCKKHGGEDYTKRIMVRTPKLIYSDFKPYILAF